MANQWLRLWHDMPNDPKWRTIARASKQSIGDVLAVYVHLLVNASNATERGRTQNVCAEDLASAIDVDTDQVSAILLAMQGRVMDGDLMTGWEKRQPVKEDGAAERAKAWREQQKAEKQQKKDADERKRTQPNATEREQALDKEKDKDTDKEYLLPTPNGVGAASDADDQQEPANRTDCPHQQIIAVYHEVLPMCPQVRDWTPARQQQLRARWNEDERRQNLDYWRRFFEYVKSCPFLVGQQVSQNRRPFFADLEWITKSANFTKIREKKYES